LMAVPSPLAVAGTELAMPSRLLWELTPAFRVPSRWSVLVMAALVPLAALGLQAGWRALARHGTRAPAALAGAAIVFSLLELTIEPADPRFRTVPVPPEYAAVKTMPAGVLAEYPLGSSDLYLLWQRVHGRSLLNGAPTGTQAEDARRMLLDPSAPGTASALAFLGVNAVVLHPEGTADVEVSPRPPAEGDEYELVARTPDGTSVWRVTAEPAPALVTLTGGFAPPRRDASGSVGYALVSPDGVGVLELTATEAGIVRLTLSATPAPDSRLTLRLAGTAGEQPFEIAGRTPVSVLVEVPRGRSRLLVKMDPSASSELDAPVVSAPRAEAASGEPSLHAEPVSADPGL
ncbi:MAG: hypothetical protein H0U82_02160, partial [Actinobacteria bacterium]|nr:hypothetical protein [Actinomycetota bacterium]